MLFLPPLILSILLILIIAIAAGEWAKLSGYSRLLAILAYVLAVFGLIWSIHYLVLSSDAESANRIQLFLGISCFWWIIAFWWVKSYPVSAVIWNTSTAKSVIGFLLLVPLWFSANFIFNLDNGRYLLMGFVILVAGADIGAYLTGKKFGQHKLIVDVSPGKTWEGFLGGICFALFLSVCSWLLIPPQYHFFDLSSLLLISMITVMASVIGDLTVSMFKRELGFKNTGTILPGHGGLLDRIDGLCGAAPVFAITTLVI